MMNRAPTYMLDNLGYYRHIGYASENYIFCTGEHRQDHSVTACHPFEQHSAVVCDMVRTMSSPHANPWFRTKAYVPLINNNAPLCIFCCRTICKYLKHVLTEEHADKVFHNDTYCSLLTLKKYSSLKTIPVELMREVFKMLDFSSNLDLPTCRYIDGKFVYG